MSFAAFKASCPALWELEVERRPGNALNLEVGQAADRCSLQSPDGRGLAWELSGGSKLAYGACCASACPRRNEATFTV
jgi:hypothetical protein